MRRKAQAVREGFAVNSQLLLTGPKVWPPLPLTVFVAVCFVCDSSKLSNWREQGPCGLCSRGACVHVAVVDGGG